MAICSAAGNGQRLLERLSNRTPASQCLAGVLVQARAKPREDLQLLELRIRKF